MHLHFVVGPERSALGQQVEVKELVEFFNEPFEFLGRPVLDVAKVEQRELFGFAVLANTLNDQRRLGWVSVYMGTHFWAVGDHGRAIEFGQRALAIAPALDDLALEVQASSRLGWVYHVLGDQHRALSFLRKSIALLEGDLIHERLGMPAHISRA
jgi:tetratricopeptide (TPR) repeat protein